MVKKRVMAFLYHHPLLCLAQIESEPGGTGCYPGVNLITVAYQAAELLCTRVF
jgi:hypothetical protein